MARPGGPTRLGGVEEYVIPDESTGEGWAIRIYPDVFQGEIDDSTYYWAPAVLRLAQFPDTADYKFSHVHFAGVLSEDANVGVETELETVGGLLAFTTTSRPPPSVMEQVRERLKQRIRGSDDPLWRWKNTAREPNLTMVPITSNTTGISSLAPDATPKRPGDLNGGSAPPSDGDLITRRGVRHGRDLRSRGTELGAWHVQLDGTGAGSTTGGENAYGGLLGMIPSELVWAALHGGATPFTISQQLLIPMATPAATIIMRGNWRQIFEHFSGQAKGSYLFFSAEISAEIENLRRSGDLHVQVVVDTTVPNAAEIQKQMEADKALILNQFMEQAKKTIFEPALPDEKAAEIQTRPGGPWSLGLAFKLVRKQIDLELRYEEERIFKYNYADTISSQLEGLRRRLKANPDEEAKYFQRVVLGSLSTKLRRIVRPVFAEEDPAARMVVEFGYASTEAPLAWKGHEFTRGGGPDQTWLPEWVQLRPGEAHNPPSGWQPDVTYMRRSVIFDQSSSVGRNPNNRTVVEVDQMRLDPPEGTASPEMAVDVRSNDGLLDVTLMLGAYLSAPNERVEVEIRPRGSTMAGAERPIQRFAWNENDQSLPRRLRIYTGQPDYQPLFDYRVRCMILAPLGKPGGQEWTGPWISAVGGDVLTVTIPDPDGEGVTRRNLSNKESRAIRAGLDVTEVAAETDGRPAHGGEMPSPTGGGSGAGGNGADANGGATWPGSTGRPARRAPRTTDVSGYHL